MEFNPNNKIVRLCLQGMQSEAQGKSNEAIQHFTLAWDGASYDFEKFISAHFIAHYQKNVSDQLHWLEIALRYALKVNDDSIQTALPSLYTNIAKCQDELGDSIKAKKSLELGAVSPREPTDQGPFYHGTKADLKIGDMLIAGGNSNYKVDLKMNHIYFTALLSGAGLAAALAIGDNPERVYIVEPTGSFEHDPNVTDKKFPGNPTRSYRSHAPLKIVSEVKDWAKQTPLEIQKWREKLANNKGDIVN